MSSFVAASSSTFFFFLKNRTCTETPLQVEVHEIIFPTSHRTHETGFDQESCDYFTPAMQSVQGWFQTAQRSIFFCHISFYGSSKLMILDALERIFEGAYEY
jgi:hypothetical protein